MKRILLALLVLSVILTMASCKKKKNEEPPHEHEYTVQSTDARYLKSAANCESGAIYYYSCACGDKGNKIFAGERELGHSFDGGLCQRCNAKDPAFTEEHTHSYKDGLCIHCGDDEPRASKGLELALNEDKLGYTVIGFGNCFATDITIPAEYNGLPVTDIGEDAFWGVSWIVSVTIPENIKTIHDWAFSNCESLKTVNISRTVTKISSLAFEESKSLENITVASENPAFKSIDGNLYTKDRKTLLKYAVGKSDVAFILPEDVSVIGEYAFAYCDYLAKVIMHDGVTRIGSHAFYYCTSLSDIVIPEKITKIESYAFAYCYSLTSITIPEGVTELEKGAFYDCRYTKSIVIPKSLTKICENAFMLYVDSLEHVYYRGNASEWSLITIEGGNLYLTNSEMHYDFTE